MRFEDMTKEIVPAIWYNDASWGVNPSDKELDQYRYHVNMKHRQQNASKGVETESENKSSSWDVRVKESKKKH